ncbi:unnamed protein product [Arabidopsis thaliana]|uniref:(thale cress) hypothetical protein n=1 Tax=Arabidopsis thaliana TaxID=3702 RepID=A0A7G2F6G8_ARATH|nr:unnamed protein product [Arabidopsis thaliana]
MMAKSLNHTPSVPDWTTLESDLSIVSLKTWEGLNTLALLMKKH